MTTKANTTKTPRTKWEKKENPLTYYSKPDAEFCIARKFPAHPEGKVVWTVWRRFSTHDTYRHIGGRKSLPHAKIMVDDLLRDEAASPPVQEVITTEDNLDFGL
jgi:hypothetical protein